MAKCVSQNCSDISSDKIPATENFIFNKAHSSECITNSQRCDHCLNRLEPLNKPKNTCPDIEEVNCRRRRSSTTLVLKKFNLCVCSHSHTFPLCDGTHLIQQRNKEKNLTILPPLTVELEQKYEDKHFEQKICTESLTINLQPQKTKRKVALMKVDKKSITSVFSKEEVAQHTSNDDCWMIIKGNVYDITPYFDHHPGGTRALLNFAGRDGTSNVEFHSSQMMKLLDTYFYIGKLEGTKESSCVIS